MRRGLLNAVVPPAIAFAVLLSLYFVWHWLDLPTGGEFISIAEGYFDKYGMWIVFLSAIVEGVLLAGWYYPGSIVIFLGIIFSGEDVVRVAEVIAATTAGLLVAYAVDYLAGKYGWYKLFVAFGLEKPIERAKERLTRYGGRAIAISYWHPNFAALTATAAGILHYPPKRFMLFSVAMVSAWNVFWGMLAYFLGEQALSLIGFRFVLIIVGAWIVGKMFFAGVRRAKPDRDRG